LRPRTPRAATSAACARVWSGTPSDLEVSGRSADPPGNTLAIWIQVRDVQFEHDRLLAAGVPVIRKPQQEPWGLVEMWIADPDGVRIMLVEVPKDHPLRRDQWWSFLLSRPPS
jgi:catechol 2,3-dioxygenase-like lactoylglutathione lyase family enzyme